MTIRILLADDHDVVRRGLTALLDGTDGFAVVGAAADGEEAIALAGEHQPDVVLMDLSMPGVDGIAATRYGASVSALELAETVFAFWSAPSLSSVCIFRSSDLSPA